MEFLVFWLVHVLYPMKIIPLSWFRLCTHHKNRYFATTVFHCTINAFSTVLSLIILKNFHTWTLPLLLHYRFAIAGLSVFVCNRVCVRVVLNCVRISIAKSLYDYRYTKSKWIMLRLYSTSQLMIDSHHLRSALHFVVSMKNILSF